MAETRGIYSHKTRSHEQQDRDDRDIDTQQRRSSEYAWSWCWFTEDERDVVSMMLYVKDRYSVSKDAYHQMARICKGMPREYLLRQRIAELNKQWNIRPTPNGVCGVQQSLEDRLRVRIVCLHQQAPPNAAFYRTITVNVKFVEMEWRLAKGCM